MIAARNRKKKTKIATKKKPVQNEPPPKKPEKKPVEGRKYAQIASESVKIKAESAGIDDLDDDVAKALGEEVSYRLREILAKCTMYMRQSKCTKLMKAHMKSVLGVNDLDYTLGHLTNPTFSLVGDTDIFIQNDSLEDLEEIIDLKDLEQVELTIRGKIVLPDKELKPVTSDKNTVDEAEQLEGKTVTPDKQPKTTAANTKKQETEPLEALGLRKVTKT